MECGLSSTQSDLSSYPGPLLSHGSSFPLPCEKSGLGYEAMSDYTCFIGLDYKWVTWLTDTSSSECMYDDGVVGEWIQVCQLSSSSRNITHFQSDIV